MTISVGDKLPEAKFRVMTAEGPQVKTTDDIFKGKKVALFAVPGAPAPATSCICRAFFSTPTPSRTRA
jgi:peroxiredoxin